MRNPMTVILCVIISLLSVCQADQSTYSQLMELHQTLEDFPLVQNYILEARRKYQNNFNTMSEWCYSFETNADNVITFLSPDEVTPFQSSILYNMTRNVLDSGMKKNDRFLNDLIEVSKWMFELEKRFKEFSQYQCGPNELCHKLLNAELKILDILIKLNDDQAFLYDFRFEIKQSNLVSYWKFNLFFKFNWHYS